MEKRKPDKLKLKKNKIKLFYRAQKSIDREVNDETKRTIHSLLNQPLFEPPASNRTTELPSHTTSLNIKYYLTRTLSLPSVPETNHSRWTQHLA